MNVFFLLFLFLLYPIAIWPDVVINEINYHPPDDALEEFIELYNPTDQEINLAGYSFSEGVQFSFSPFDVIPPKGYLILVQRPEDVRWSHFQNRIVGPYSGKLANEGERITLVNNEGEIVESVYYLDQAPWPLGADGYGASLERINPDAPANDFHSWRLSRSTGGSPLIQNSVYGFPPGPALRGIRFTPERPRSTESTQVEVFLDMADQIEQVNLWVLPMTETAIGETFAIPLIGEGSNEIAVYKGEIPPFSSETLVRVRIEILRTDGHGLYWPDRLEPRPFESYFIYDMNIPAALPILWLFDGPVPNESEHVRRTGVVIQPSPNSMVQVFDGAIVEPSRSGQKIHFLKGEEYEGNRTWNLLFPHTPEMGTEAPPPHSTAGPMTPHLERLGYQLYSDFGVLSLGTSWHRVIERGRHTQRLVIQQPNENFLALNGRDPDGDIYKLQYENWIKKTNLDEGREELEALLCVLELEDPELRGAGMRNFLDISEITSYEVVTVLISNWDGLWNNFFLYYAPPPVDRWECIPWDLDQTWGFAGVYVSMLYDMPVTFPIDGVSRLRKPPGPLSRPFHLDEELNQLYLDKMREALNDQFSIERLQEILIESKTPLLEDLDLLEEYTGRPRMVLRQQIEDAYKYVAEFMELRYDYLNGILNTMIDDWTLY